MMILRSQADPEIRLGTFLTCEKVLFDQAGIPSLISIFRSVTVNETVAQEENAAFPFPWTVYTTWDRSSSEQELKFTQELQITLPDGASFVQSEIAFTLPQGEDQARIAAIFLAVPVWQNGDITIRASLREQNLPSAEIRVNIRRVPPTHIPIIAAV